MFKNYLTIAWRNISQHKTYAAINIVGLAVGIAACLLLFIVVKYELSYDTFQPNYDRIYHVAAKLKSADGDGYQEGIPYPAYDALRVQFPDLTTGAIVANYDAQVTVLDEKNPNNFTNKKFLEETGLFFADPNFFSVFQYEWLAGDAKVLIAPNTAVIEKKWAEKYFGNWQSAMGRLIMFDNTATMKIEGVMEVPAHTDFPIGIVGSYENMKKYPRTYGYSDHWGSVTSNFQAFMLLPPKVSAESVNKRLTVF